MDQFFTKANGGLHKLSLDNHSSTMQIYAQKMQMEWQTVSVWSGSLIRVYTVCSYHTYYTQIFEGVTLLYIYLIILTETKVGAEVEAKKENGMYEK